MEEITCAIVTYFGDTLTLGCGTGYYCGINTQLGLQGCVENVGNSPANSPPSSSASSNLGCVGYSDAQNNCDQACSQFTSRLTCPVDQPNCATVTIAFDQQQFYSFYCASVDGLPSLSGTGFTPNLYQFALDGYTSVPADAQPGVNLQSLSSHGFGLGPGPPASAPLPNPTTTDSPSSVIVTTPRPLPMSPQSTAFSSNSIPPPLSSSPSSPFIRAPASSNTFEVLEPVSSSSSLSALPLSAVTTSSQGPAFVSSSLASFASSSGQLTSLLATSPLSLTSLKTSSQNSLSQSTAPTFLPQTPPSTSNVSAGLSQGASVGIGFGASIAGLAIIALLVARLLCMRRRSRASNERAHAYTPANNAGNDPHSPSQQAAFSPFLDQPHPRTSEKEQANQLDGVEAKEMQALFPSSLIKEAFRNGFPRTPMRPAVHEPFGIRNRQMQDITDVYHYSELHGRHKPSEMSPDPSRWAPVTHVVELQGLGRKSQPSSDSH